MSAHPTADRIEQVAFGFMASKVIFSAIKFGLFSELAKGPLDVQALKARLGLHPRSAPDFLDALVALGMLERLDECYSVTPESDFYLDRANRVTSVTTSSCGTSAAIHSGVRWVKR